VKPIHLIEHSYQIVLLAVAVIGIFLYKKLNEQFKILALSAIGSFLVNVASTLTIKILGTNAPALHVESPMLYIFYALVYYCLFTSKNLKAAIAISIFLVSLLAIINAVTFQPFLTTFPTYIDQLTLAILALLSLLLFRQMLLAPSTTPLLSQSIFWYNTAILFYATTLFFISALSNYSLAYGTYMDLTYLWYVILFIFAILLTLSLLKASKENQRIHAKG
jgi:hypothetical protein